jgi:hypothetical protein
MRKHARKLALNVETLKVLSPRSLAHVGGGVPNYNTSIDHKGCSAATIATGCWTAGLSYCGPCLPEA